MSGDGGGSGRWVSPARVPGCPARRCWPSRPVFPTVRRAPCCVVPLAAVQHVFLMHTTLTQHDTAIHSQASL